MLTEFGASLQAPAPDAFVLATGRNETIRTFVNIAYKTQGIGLEWQGSRRASVVPKDRQGSCIRRQSLFPSLRCMALIGDASRAALELGSAPRITLEEIVEEMVALTDIQRAKSVPLSLKS